MRNLFVLLLVTFFLSSCSTMPGFPGPLLYQDQVEEKNQDETQVEPGEPEEEPEKEEVREPEKEEKEKRSFIVELLLYIPSRVLDLFDIARAGISVGPGIGFDVTATEYINVALITKATVGLGYQTLRHSPIESTAYSAVGLGPVREDPEAGMAWYRSSGDLRIELHLLLIGAHICVEPFEIFDFIVGFIRVDPEEDDL